MMIMCCGLNKYNKHLIRLNLELKNLHMIDIFCAVIKNYLHLFRYDKPDNARFALTIIIEPRMLSRRMRNNRCIDGCIKIRLRATYFTYKPVPKN